MIKLQKFIYPAGIFLVLLLLLISPQTYSASFSKGILLWAKSILPAIFPFLFLSKLLVDSGSLNGVSKTAAPLVKKLFNAPKESSTVFLISLLCGYPVAAKLSCELYERGVLTSANCTKIATFSGLASPVFIVASVGASFLGNPAFGACILAAHILGALICGLLLRGAFCDTANTIVRNSEPNLNKSAVADIMQNCILSMLAVGAFVAIFFVFTEVIFVLFPQLEGSLAGVLVAGVLEMSGGCSRAATLPSLPAILACCFFVSFGGLCVFAQTWAFYQKCKQKVGMLLLIKLLHATISTLICLPLALLIT